jgi:translation initiation factor IF-2
MAEQKKEVQEKIFKGKILSLEDFSKGIKEGQIHDLNLIIKADVQGSLDALQKTLQNLMIGNLRVNIIHHGTGAVTESDVMLAKASDAIIVGFNVGYEGKAESLGSDEGVEIRFYNIIYKLVDDVKLAMEGMLEPEYEEVVTGHAEVRNLFKFSKVGTIAGCFVTDGKMVRGAKIRMFRSKAKLFEGKLDSLKRFKDDVKTVEQNFECGIAVLGFNDFEVGDIIENIEIKEKARGK